MRDKLPDLPAGLTSEQPDLWSAYAELGRAAKAAGPLDGKTCRLVHLAMALAAGSEGATHSHARRGLADGLTAEELEHVAFLAVTTLGWPQAMRGLSWIRDITRPDA